MIVMFMQNRLSVIIVNWNTKDLLKQCLSSLCENTARYLLGDVIVVDNGSIDGSVEMVRQNFPMVRLILNEENLGFAVSNNRALQVACGDYVLFLNTDVVIKKDAIEKLIDFMDTHPDCALCTPSLIRKDGSKQESYTTFPTIITELFGRLPQKNIKEPFKVQSIRGACMLARRDVINSIGGFNERYFLFLEETDLCLRLYKNGYSVWYVPNVEVVHTGGGSVERDPVGARIEYWRSRYIFFRQNYPFYKYILLSVGLWIKLFFNLLNINRFRQNLVIILWHILGKPGDWGIGLKGYVSNLPKGIDRGVIVKENRIRRLVLYNGEFIKIYKKRYFFKKPWLREWRLINRVRQLDIPTIKPIAYGEGFLVTKKIDGVKTLHEFVLQDLNRIDFRERLDLTRSLAGFIKKLHRKGIYHGDLHSGNILIGKDGFYITDLHRARIKISLSRWNIINNLVQLDNFFSMNASPQKRLRFFKYYVLGTGMEKDYRRYARVISRISEGARYRLWRKRDRQYLKKDKYGIRGRYKGIDYILNPVYKDIDIGLVFKYLRPGYGDVLKNSRSSYLSRYNIPGVGNVVVKINRQKRFINYIKDIFRNSRGFRAWCGSWALITRDVQTPEPIMAGERRRFGVLLSSFIIVREVKDGKVLSSGNFSRSDLEKFVRRIHDRGIFHPDMKASNIIVGEDGGFYLVDLDHIKIMRHVQLSKRLYNIRQIRKTIGFFPTGALPVKRILIVKPSSLGDIVQALPVASVIRREYPGANIWWLVNSRYVELLKLSPYIDRIIAFERARWGKWRRLWRTVFELSRFLIEIRRLHFDIVLDLQGLFRSGFITWFSGAPLRIGFGRARECSGLFYTNRIYTGGLHARERYLEVAKFIAMPSQEIGQLDIPVEKIDWAERIWGDNRIRIAINPGARWRTKRWGSTRYAELIDELSKKHMARIILVGDKDDISIGDDIEHRVNCSITNLIGRTTLTELVAILSRCSLLITNDSGPMHIADYMGKPIVAIFGPTDPKRTGPIGKDKKILKAKIHCSPCFKRYCRDPVCMGEITVNDVLGELNQIMGQSPYF